MKKTTKLIPCLIGRMGYYAAVLMLLSTSVTQAAVTLNYVQSDHLGTPRVLSDDNGETVWQLHQTPFGKATINQDVDGDGSDVVANLRFPGQYYDAETGLYYNYFRYYDPETGRYITSDPIGLSGGLNTYGYVGGNPLKYIDPEGLAMIYSGSGAGAGWDPTIMKNNLDKAEDPCGCFSKVLGLETAVGAGAVVAGQPIPNSKPWIHKGSSIGTSTAGQVADKLFGKKKFPIKYFPRGAPTISGGPGTGSRLRKTRTRSVARFVGRWVPFAGWGLLALDAAQLTKCLAECESENCKDGN